MTTAAVAFLVAAALVAAADWWAVATDRRAVEYVCKPLALLLLVGAGLTLQPEIASRRAWFVAGLSLSLIGDVVLMLPQDLFVAGLASFLGGHLCYVAGLTRHGGSALVIGLAVVGVGVVGIVPAARILPAARRHDPKMLGPVTVYMVVISVMLATAAASGAILAACGAALFYVSDASIAWDKFVKRWSWARTWIMVTYHLGQAGLVISLAR